MLTEAQIAAIEEAVDDMYDRARSRFLGPQSVNRILSIEYSRPMSLPGMVEAVSNHTGVLPNMDSLAALVRTASNYIEASRARSKAQVVHAVDSFILNSRRKKTNPDDVMTVLGGELAELWGQITADVRRIFDTEMQRAKNITLAEGIVKVNEAAGVADPVMFFVVVRDGALCDECKQLHLQPDGVTPRVWKMSEIEHGHHVKGSGHPSIAGNHPHCFTGGMKLHTKNGLVPFRDLYGRSDFVEIVTDNRVVVKREGGNQFGVEIPGQTRLHRHKSGTSFRRSSAVFSGGVQPCYRVELESGHVLEVSEGHEHWVDDGNSGKKVRTVDLKAGDKLPIVSGESGFGGASFEQMAELMGNLMGDGSLCDEVASWRFFGDDIEYGSVLKKMMDDEIEARAPRSNRAKGHPLVVRPPDGKYNVPNASMSSLVLGEAFCKEFGLSKKPRRVPARLWVATKKTVAAFLRGLYAADGHSEVTPSVVLAQNDLEFLREIQTALSMFGISARIFAHGAGQAKTITYSNGESFLTERKACWRLAIGGAENVAKFASEIGFGVPRKDRELKERLAARPKSAHTRASSSWRTARISAIEYIGEQEVFCVSEPIAESVVVNGVVSGNCRCVCATILPGFGFTPSGMVTWIREGYSELEAQRGISKSEPLGKYMPEGEDVFKKHVIPHVMTDMASHDHRKYLPNPSLPPTPLYDAYLQKGQTAPIAIHFPKSAEEGWNKQLKANKRPRWLNLGATKTGMGATHEGVRKEREQTSLGIPSKVSWKRRPVYGALHLGYDAAMKGYGGQTFHGPLGPSETYGSAYAVLKEHVKDRATVSSEDSFSRDALVGILRHDTHLQNVMRKHAPPVEAFADPAIAETESKRKILERLAGYWRSTLGLRAHPATESSMVGTTHPYLEAQVYGGVDMGDVKEFHTADPDRLDGLLAYSKALHDNWLYEIPVVFHNIDEEAKSTGKHTVTIHKPWETPQASG